MLDFASALYLGLRHESASLRPWDRLTTGAPAALAALEGADRVARGLAALQGCEAATLFPSTLHLFWDLADVLSAQKVAVYLDAGAYPIAAWGVERAAARGTPTRRFHHHDADALRDLVTRRPGARIPVVVTDGFCPPCGRAAPLAAYLEVVREHEGLLVIDDTQALGVLGASEGSTSPYGEGGGGSLRRWSLASDRVLLASSLAKAFGAPLAALSGPERLVRAIEARSLTRVHSSPPCAAVIRAAERALVENRERGDALRLRLLHNVRRLRGGLRRGGLATAGGPFPVQTVAPIRGVPAARLHEALFRRRLEAVLAKAHGGEGARVTLVITAAHERADIDAAIEALTVIARVTRSAAAA